MQRSEPTLHMLSMCGMQGMSPEEINEYLEQHETAPM